MADGRRKTIRLGKVSQRAAETFRTHVEHLVSAAIGGHAPADATVRWVAGLDDRMTCKLARVGLVRERERATLADFLDTYIKSRCDTKPGTTMHYRRVERDLVNLFGGAKLLRDFTAGDADRFRLYLLSRKLGENTVRRRCGRARQFFAAAVRQGLIPSNPFTGLKTAVQANPSRFYFLNHDDAQKVIDACPDAEWRLLFALSRWGGLRCPCRGRP